MLESFGCRVELGVSFTQKFLRSIASEGPFIVNVDAHEYVAQIGRTKRERVYRGACYHFLFVRKITKDGYYECDDAYTTEPRIYIPEDMMSRMLRAHHQKGNVLVIHKTAA
jgi:hypothetical protein